MGKMENCLFLNFYIWLSEHFNIDPMMFNTMKSVLTF